MGDSKATLKANAAKAVGFIVKHGQAHGTDYSTLGVTKGHDGRMWVLCALALGTVDEPGDRITQPAKNGKSKGGRLGYCKAFSGLVRVRIGDRALVAFKGAFVTSDAKPEDLPRFGERADDPKWTGAVTSTPGVDAQDAI